jgi:hypothetical protein
MMNEIISRETQKTIDTMLPNGSGVVTEIRLRHVLENALNVAYSVGGDDALSSLLDIDAALFAVNQALQNDGRKPISKRRLHAIARERHDRFAVGMQIGKTGVWLFRQSEIELLIPREYNRGDA